MKNLFFKSQFPFNSFRFILKTIAVFVFLFSQLFAQETVTDYDGNVYNTIKIGNQTWLKENMNCLHYADGTEIPGVVSYNNDNSLADIYGRLYTWDAAMRNSTEEDAQGIAPDGWHIPSDAEWKELENYLGGTSVAGGKMKETGIDYWKTPNTGATNESGFSALPAGEYDAHYSPNIFQFLKTTAVFWTSTEITSTKARERYLTHDKNASLKYDWYKEMKYSIRCIKDKTTDIKPIKNHEMQFDLKQNYPNPFNPTTIISFSIPGKASSDYSTLKTRLTVFNSLGEQVAVLFDEYRAPGNYEIEFNGTELSSGVYFYTLQTGLKYSMKKMVLIK